jgi:hypothetical protein
MISRRHFLHVSGLSAGGLLIGCTALEESPDAGSAPVPAAQQPVLPASFGAFIEITPTIGC